MVKMFKVLVIVGTIVPTFAAPINMEGTNLDRSDLRTREPEPINPAALIKAGKMGYRLLSGVSLATSFSPLFHHHHKNKNQPREFVEEVQLEIRAPIIFPTMAEIKAFGKFLGMAGKKAKGGVEFGATVAPFIPRLRKSKQNQPNHRRSLEDLERRGPSPMRGLRLPHMKLPYLRLPHLHFPHVKFPHIGHGTMAKVGGSVAAAAGFSGIIAASQLQNRDLGDVEYEAARENDDYNSYTREYDDEEIYARRDDEDIYSPEYDDIDVEARQWELGVDLREIAGFDELV